MPRGSRGWWSSRKAADGADFAVGFGIGVESGRRGLVRSKVLTRGGGTTCVPFLPTATSGRLPLVMWHQEVADASCVRLDGLGSWLKGVMKTNAGWRSEDRSEPRPRQPVASSARMIRSGVRGRCDTSQPSAWFTALTTAAATGMVAISPTALAPKGPVGSPASTR